MATEVLETNDAFADKLAGAITKGIAETAPKKVPFSKYEPRTPWQPGKKKAMHVLAYKVYQNGFRVSPKKLTNTEIDYLNQIRRPGRYISRRVEVALWSDGGDTSLDLRYSNKNPEQRFENKNYWRNFEELVRLIVEEQNEILERKERQDQAVERLLKADEDQQRKQAQMVVEADDDDEDADEGLERNEATAPTPKQEMAAKKAVVPRERFASAATREARAKAAAKDAQKVG